MATHKNTPEAFLVISDVSLSVAPLSNCSIRRIKVWLDSLSVTNREMSWNVKSWRRRLSQIEKAETQTGIGLLDSTSLTTSDFEAVTRRSVRSAWSPSYSSMPSMNRHILEFNKEPFTSVVKALFSSKNEG